MDTNDQIVVDFSANVLCGPPRLFAAWTDTEHQSLMLFVKLALTQMEAYGSLLAEGTNE